MKEFSSKPVYFTYLGIMVLTFSITFALNIIDLKFVEQNSIFYVLLSLIASGFFFYLGNKKRRLVVDENQIAYYSSNMPFVSPWKEIAVIKSFQEMGKSAENLVIIKEDDSILTISSAFFNIEELQNAFIFIANIAKSHQSISIEDDLNWLKN